MNKTDRPTWINLLLAAPIRHLKKFRIGVNSTLPDPQTIQAFTDNPTSTFLVSFPRTGSHWLRMLMELYFERPLLTRSFYYPGCTDYLALHTHDLDLTVNHKNVIYLYRNPIDTIYSQLSYYKESIDSPERIHYWADQYAGHLDKWLHQEQFTTHKTILQYERLKQNLPAEFVKVVKHFGQPFYEAQLDKADKQITKEEVKKKTRHDPQVVKFSETYEQTRQWFTETQGDVVWSILLKNRHYLNNYFSLYQ